MMVTRRREKEEGRQVKDGFTTAANSSQHLLVWLTTAPLCPTSLILFIVKETRVCSLRGQEISADTCGSEHVELLFLLLSHCSVSQLLNLPFFFFFIFLCSSQWQGCGDALAPASSGHGRCTGPAPWGCLPRWWAWHWLVSLPSLSLCLSLFLSLFLSLSIWHTHAHTTALSNHLTASSLFDHFGFSLFMARWNQRFIRKWRLAVCKIPSERVAYID